MASKNKPVPFADMQSLLEKAKITQDELVEEYQKPTTSSSKPKPKPSNSEKPNKPPGKPPNSKSKPKIEKEEFFDSEEELSKKLDVLAEWVKTSKHFIVFTGAGISTSTGIPDFRSGMNTVLPTGPGAWELKAHGVERKKVSTLTAIPSITHMSIVKLHQEGLLKFVISQNTDGLHRRSGLGSCDVAELHGNTNLEICKKCGAQYLRDFRVRNARKVHDHYTGRICDEVKCNGHLQDTIINFGEDLPEEAIDKGFEEAKKADLCLVLGSSLTVTPAADIPELVADRGHKLVICNLQKTPLHNAAKLALFSLCDNIMEGLMLRLGLEIPKFILKRRLWIELESSDDKTLPKDPSGTYVMIITGMDPTKDIPFSFIKSAQVKVFQMVKGKESVLIEKVLSQEPLVVKFKVAVPMSKAPVVAKVTLEFQGHYGEPSLTLEHKAIQTGSKEEYIINYDPRVGQWQ